MIHIIISPALMTSFSNMPFNSESEESNYGKIPPFCTSLTLFPKIPFTNKQVIGCIIKKTIGSINLAAIGVIKAGRALPFCFLFHALLFQ